MTIGVIESLTNDSAVQQQDQPFWQFVLREFLFRTISSSPDDNSLYTNLLDAPFYGGPLSEASNDDNALLSRGSVYRTFDQQWILCQEDCAKCEFCVEQKNLTARWTLRRVIRRTSEGSPKWDLRLSVMPQLDEILASDRSDRWPHNYAYATKEYEPGPAESAVHATTDRANVLQERRTHSTEMASVDRKDQLSRGNGISNEDSALRAQNNRRDYWKTIRSRDVTRTKRRRSKVKPIGRPGPLAFHYPQEDNPIINSPTLGIHDEVEPRLIIGIDQDGEKHLIHVVPIYSTPRNQRHSSFSSTNRDSYRRVNSPRISRTIQKSSDEVAYEKLIDRIFNSLNTHRNFIKTFLFSDRLDPEISKQAAVNTYTSYTDGRINDDETYPSRNDPDYRSRFTQRDNRYTGDSEYQVEEHNERYEPYDDITREIKKTAALDQDKSSMIEYGPYGISAKDQSDDERSLRTETERKRRYSFNEPTDSLSAFGYRGNVENHNKVDNNDSVVAIRNEVVESFGDKDPDNSRLAVNHTEPGIKNLSVVSSTVKL